jgi:hypothetical protein
VAHSLFVTTIARASDAGMHAQWPATRPPFAVGGEEEMDLDSEMEDMQQQRVFFLFFFFLCEITYNYYFYCCFVIVYLLI